LPTTSPAHPPTSIDEPHTNEYTRPRAVSAESAFTTTLRGMYS